jgi:hypothetical protein
MNQAMVLSESQEAPSGNKRLTKASGEGGPQPKGAATVDAAYIPSDDEGSETDERTPAAFKQRELVAMAFAGDNVVEVRAKLGWYMLHSDANNVGFRYRKTTSSRR